MSCGAVDPACRKCRLFKGRTNVVPGTGPCDAKIIFVGEAPGKDEDLRVRPFVGRAGRLLDEALEGAGVGRAKVRISNLVKCRPPGNRRPRADEKSRCTSLYLHKEIEEISPRVICALGQTAAEHLAGRKLKMADVVGKEVPHASDRTSARLFVTYHPAACLYQRKNIKAFKRGVRASLVAAGLTGK
ncbi:MAG: uracil-DNA glycosylase [Candidatus Thermoplasmatota archaeon]|nr:uracil-DNA glycosylase [Candidatus Thermoplasmatota archaeon]